MHTLHPLPPWHRLALFALGLLAAHSPLTAQADTPVPVALTGFPDPLWLALVVIAACGAVGAFAADLVTDGGRIEQWRRDEGGWSLGFVAKMVIGLVAAIIFLTLNPPGEVWVALVGTALAAGIGGEAILLAIIASRRAQAAESEKNQSRVENERMLGDWEGSVRRLQSVTLAAATTNGGANGQLEDGSVPSRLAEVVQASAEGEIAEIRRRAALARR